MKFKRKLVKSIIFKINPQRKTQNAEQAKPLNLKYFGTGNDDQKIY